MLYLIEGVHKSLTAAATCPPRYDEKNASPSRLARGLSLARRFAVRPPHPGRAGSPDPAPFGLAGARTTAVGGIRPLWNPRGIWSESKSKRRYETPSLILQILKILLMRFSSHENPVHVLAMSFFSEICAVFALLVLKKSTKGRIIVVFS